MPTLALCTGFEFGTTAGLTTGSVGSKIIDTQPAGTATIVTSATSAPHTGTYCLRMVKSAAAGYLQWTADTLGASNTGIAVSMWVKVESQTGDVTLCSSETSATNKRWVSFVRLAATGTIQVQYRQSGSLISSANSSNTISTGTWFRLEWSHDVAATTHAVKWGVDGVGQADFNVGSQAANTLNFLVLGTGFVETVTMCLDDVVVSMNAADYPLGDHKIVLLTVDTGATVTLSGTASNWRTFADATPTLTAWNATTARDAIDEVPPNLGSSQDGLTQIASAASDYVEIPMTTYTLQSGESISGLRMVACGWAATATATNLGFRSYNGTAETTLLAIAAGNITFNNTSTPGWCCRMCTPADFDTQTELDALAFRVGFGTDANPDSGIQAIYAELAIKIGAIPVALAETASAADTIATSTTLPTAETGTAVGAAATGATVPLADTGTAADTITVTITKALTETGSASMSTLAAITAPLTETGTAAHSDVIAAAVPLTDTTSSTDTTSTTTLVPLTEAGAGSGTSAATAAAGPTETGFGVETPDVTAAATLPDTAAAVDALTIATTKTLTESGTGTDTAAVGTTKTLTDTAAATDTVLAAAVVPATDTGTADNNLTAAAGVATADTGTGASVVVVAAALPLVETGADTDILAAAATASLAEAGAAAETAAVDAGGAPHLTDSGTVGEDTGITVDATTGEPASISDGLTVSVAVGVTDVGGGSDALVVSVTKTLTEAVAVADEGGVGVVVPLAETGTGPGVLAATVTAELAEAASASDAAFAAGLVVFVDAGSVVDAIDASAGRVPQTEVVTLRVPQLVATALAVPQMSAVALPVPVMRAVVLPVPGDWPD